MTKYTMKECGHYCRKDDHIGQCCNCRTWSKNDCDLCKDGSFELIMKAGSVFYEKKQLKDRLKRINEIAIKSIDRWKDGYIDIQGYREIKEQSDV